MMMSLPRHQEKLETFPRAGLFKFLNGLLNCWGSWYLTLIRCRTGWIRMQDGGTECWNYWQLSLLYCLHITYNTKICDMIQIYLRCTEKRCHKNRRRCEKIWVLRDSFWKTNWDWCRNNAWRKKMFSLFREEQKG